MNTEVKTLARLLRTPEGIILKLKEKMDKIAGKSGPAHLGVIERIVQENKKKVEQALKEMGFKKKDHPTPEQVFQSLLKKTKETNEALLDYFGRPDFSKAGSHQGLIDAIKKLVGDLTGFYLKKEKAEELFRNNPPRRIMAELGYGDVEQMLKKEDIFELFSALRFAEDNDWLNNVFLKPYFSLNKDDFEEREIRIMVLSDKWAGIGEKFLGGKLHHMSHLKEMGIVFVIPVKKINPGEALYLLFMTLHYIFEVDWHARLFKSYSPEPDFARKMTEALKVETSTLSLPDSGRMSWRIAPSYLAKKNPDDPRLFEPHLSPESWHFSQAGAVIDKFSQESPETKLGFWSGLDAVIGIFAGGEKEELVSFNLFDNGISLLGQDGFEPKYLYHQQETLWNKLFIEYLGKEKLDQVLMENLNKGFVAL